MSLYSLLGALEVGLVYGFLAIGIYISFRVLDFPDLTVDGSFPLGAAITAVLLQAGFNPWLSLVVVAFAGAMAGATTAYISKKYNILHLLASILVMLGLYSINLRIMGRPNIPVLNANTIFTFLGEAENVYTRIIVIISLLAGFVLFTAYLLSTNFGLGLRAVGSNIKHAQAQGVDSDFYTIVGIALANSLSAISGAIFTHLIGFADVTIGAGTIIFGLAAVIIGEIFIKSSKILISLIAVIIGSIVYRVAIAWALNADFIGLKASDLNLVTAVIVCLALVISSKQIFKQKND